MTLTTKASCRQRYRRVVRTAVLPLRGVSEVPELAPLLDAIAASKLLGVPRTWLLAQARARKIPHHRLGHYVRFSAEDLRVWLAENRIAPREPWGSSGLEHALTRRSMGR